ASGRWHDALRRALVRGGRRATARVDRRGDAALRLAARRPPRAPPASVAAPRALAYSVPRQVIHANSPCTGSRAQSRDLGIRRKRSGSSAMSTFAGYTATRVAISQARARRRVLLGATAKPPTSSAIPLATTTWRL